SAARLQTLWDDLAGSDEGKAARALLELARSPDPALKLLEKELRPVKVDAKHVAKLIKDLDGDEFATREAAAKELEYLGKSVKGTLEKDLEKPPSAEVKKRLSDLLKKTPGDEKAPAAPPKFRGRSISTQVINGEIKITVDGKPLDLTPR